MLAGDITYVEVCTSGAHNVVYLVEDNIGLGVFTGTLPPFFNDACVVTKAFEIDVGAIECNEGRGKEFKAQCKGMGWQANVP